MELEKNKKKRSVIRYLTTKLLTKIEKAILWRGRLQRFINQHTGNHETVATENETSNNRTVSETKEMKMPCLQMSTFYGDLNKWLEFWNQFECTIHNNGNLSKTENLHI
ncbi:hypothetical protein AVEN_124355-1 [Araneus ventricosus]|uniref:Uncharacterized protein n=1 Tax=Araneus ventricosus TaxID=182803 RepID=A0A4Y2TVP0_ARAVE|nr:hypothetical protein AVEN_124355-1 [Araneus ventricosus]